MEDSHLSKGNAAIVWGGGGGGADIQEFDQNKFQTYFGSRQKYSDRKTGFLWHNMRQIHKMATDKNCNFCQLRRSFASLCIYLY